MGIFNGENRLFVAKKEGTPGTAETFSAADYNIRVRNLALGALTVEMDNENSKFATGDHTQDEAIPGIKKGEISFDVKIAPGVYSYTGAISSFPEGKLFACSGLTEAYVGATGIAGEWKYTPTRASDATTLTAAIIDIETGSSPKAIEYKVAGAMGTLSIGCEGTGKPFMANFKFSGKVDGVTELVSIPEYSDTDGIGTLADKFLDTTVQITPLDVNGNEDGAAIEFCTNSFSLELGSEISSINCQADLSGILYDSITARKPMVKINPLLTNLTTWDFFDSLNTVTLYKVEIINASVSLEVPRAQLMNNSIGDDSGRFRNELNFRPLRNILGATQAEKEAVFTLSISEIEKVY